MLNMDKTPPFTRRGLLFRFCSKVSNLWQSVEEGLDEQVSRPWYPNSKLLTSDDNNSSIRSDRRQTPLTVAKIRSPGDRDGIRVVPALETVVGAVERADVVRASRCRPRLGRRLPQPRKLVGPNRKRQVNCLLSGLKSLSQEALEPHRR
jgi:hypothetical protein